MAATPEFRHKHVRIDQRKLDRARRILEAETETETLDRALGVVVVTDPSKFGRQAMVPVASLEEVDVVVSTDGLSPEHRGLLERAGVELILA